VVPELHEHEGTYVPAGTIPGANGQQATSYAGAGTTATTASSATPATTGWSAAPAATTCTAAFGNDLMNADDDHTTTGLLNDQPDTQPTFEDRATARRPRRADRQHRRRPA
jgi:hypothetical protein